MLPPAEIDWNALLSRLDRLEAENGRMRGALRRHRWAMVAAVIVLGSLSSMAGWAAMKKPDILEARAFKVKDAGGKVRASLYCDAESENQTPVFVLFDRDGNSRILMNLEENDMPTMNMYGPGNASRLVTMLGADGSPIQVFFAGRLPDGRENSLILGQRQGQDYVGLQWLDEAERIRCGLGMQGDHSVVLEMYDGRGIPRVAVRSMEDGSNRGLYVRNDVDEYCVIGQLGDGSVGFVATDHLEQATLLLHKTLGDTPALSFIDKDGEPILSLPEDLRPGDDQ